MFWCEQQELVDQMMILIMHVGAGIVDQEFGHSLALTHHLGLDLECELFAISFGHNAERFVVIGL